MEEEIEDFYGGYFIPIEEFISPESFDLAMAFGFRRGSYCFDRTSSESYNMDDSMKVIPLRIVLNKFFLSKSQKRTIRKNQDLTVKFKPLEITDEIDELYSNHARRFKPGTPVLETISMIVDERRNPCLTLQCEVRDKDKLVAVSFLDIGKVSTSSVYAMFDLEYSKRRLGIYTMLLEIEYSIKIGKKFYYLGYAHDKSSCYDYKKTFHAMEYLDWNKRKWLPFPRLTTL